MRLLKAVGLTELGQVASGSVMQGLWLGDRKIGSQVSGIDRSRIPGEEQLEKLGKEEDQEEEPATERRREHTDLRLDLGERGASRLPCLSLALGNDRRGTSGSGDVSLAIFRELQRKPYVFH